MEGLNESRNTFYVDSLRSEVKKNRLNQDRLVKERRVESLNKQLKNARKGF